MTYSVQVDATKEGELAKEYFVQGFPTLILFRKGVKVEDYSGPRTSKEIVSYMRKQADPDWKPPPSLGGSLREASAMVLASWSPIILFSMSKTL